MDQLRIVCTDKNEHPRRDLGLIQWIPEALHRDGSAVWDAKEDQSVHLPEALAEAGRETRSGQWRTTKRGRVETRTRKDGGTTFTFPSCPTCRRRAVPLRDDTLGKALRDGLDVVDVSLIP